MAKSINKIEEEAKGWLKKQLAQGLIVFEKSSIDLKYFKTLKLLGLLADLNLNYCFAKQSEDIDSQSFKDHFWMILVQFLNLSFDNAWYLSGQEAYQALGKDLQVPTQQITISTKNASNRVIKLFNAFSIVASTDKNYESKPLFDYQVSSASAKQSNLSFKLLKPEYLIINSSSSQYQNYQEDIVAALKSKNLDANYIIKYFRESSSPVLLQRFIGALTQVKSKQVLKIELEDILKLSATKIRKQNPFVDLPYLTIKENDEYLTRFEISINKAKEYLLAMEKPLPCSEKFDSVELDKLAVEDAYHSLTIEGYTVTKALISHINELESINKEDTNLHNQLAAKGFMNALNFIKKLIKGSYEINEEISQELWRQLWLPSINAKLIDPGLDVYRNHQVAIRGARYTPPEHSRLRAMLSIFFDHVSEVPEGFAQAVFAHYFYVGIHPHSDGNGRVSRFLMNLALVKGQYKWLTIPSGERQQYFLSLENSKLNDDISHFALYIKSAYEKAD